MTARLLNTTGGVNTAIGLDALIFNSIGQENTAIGANALFTNTKGNRNTAMAFSRSLPTLPAATTRLSVFSPCQVTTGSSNIALGANALANSTGQISTPRQAQTWYGQTALGAAMPTSAIRASPAQIDIIAIGCVAASGTDIQLLYRRHLRGDRHRQRLPVFVDTDGHLGTVLPMPTEPSAAPLRRGKGVQPQASFNHKIEKSGSKGHAEQKQIAQTETNLPARDKLRFSWPKSKSRPRSCRK